MYGPKYFILPVSRYALSAKADLSIANRAPCSLLGELSEVSDNLRYANVFFMRIISSKWVNSLFCREIYSDKVGKKMPTILIYIDKIYIKLANLSLKSVV
jgi:hypothetical protein